MAQELLQQLRDIHPPAAPPWWPPAPGWWMLGAVAVATLTWLGIRFWRRWRRFRPARKARLLYRELVRQVEAQSISQEAWLHETNKLLKRLAVHGLGHREMIPAWSEDWLHYLDSRYGQPAFSRGPGRCLGPARFRPDANSDVQAAAALIGRFLNLECRRFWRPRSGEHRQHD